MLRKTLLVCGILSALLYAAMLVFVPMRWPAYSSAAQTVSELSAIGAPTRSLWASLGVVWALLYAAFGWGRVEIGGAESKPAGRWWGDLRRRPLRPLLAFHAST